MAALSVLPLRNARLRGIYAFILVSSALLSSCGDGRRVEFANGDVYYTENVQEEEARKLGEFFEQKKYFNEKRERVEVDRSGEIYKVRMPVSDDQQNSAAYLAGVKTMSLELSKNAFNDARVEIDLTDEKFNSLKVVPPTNYGTRLGFNGADLYYTPAVSAVEAKRLGTFLVKDKYFDGRPATVQLARSGQRYAFRVMVKPGLYKDTAFLQRCRLFGARLSRNVFGNAPVDMHLCNALFKTVTVVQSTPTAKADSTAAAKPNS